MSWGLALEICDLLSPWLEIDGLGKAYFMPDRMDKAVAHAAHRNVALVDLKIEESRHIEALFGNGNLIGTYKNILPPQNLKLCGRVHVLPTHHPGSGLCSRLWPTSRARVVNGPGVWSSGVQEDRDVRGFNGFKNQSEDTDFH